MDRQVKTGRQTDRQTGQTDGQTGTGRQIEIQTGQTDVWTGKDRQVDRKTDRTDRWMDKWKDWQTGRQAVRHANRWPVATLCKCFKIPPIKLGEKDGSIIASNQNKKIQHLRLLFVAWTICRSKWNGTARKPMAGKNWQARESTGTKSGQDAQKRSKLEKRLTWQDNGLSRQPRQQNKPGGKLCRYPQFTQTQSVLWYTNCCPVCPQCQQWSVCPRVLPFCVPNYPSWPVGHCCNMPMLFMPAVLPHAA